MGRTAGFGGLGGGLGAIIAGMARSRNKQTMDVMLKKNIKINSKKYSYGINGFF